MAPAPSPDADPGARRIVGRYRLEHELGRGAMGTVWSAYDEVLHRPVAVKEVRLSSVPAGERAVVRERTLREARATAMLSHPNVVTLYDVVEVESEPYVVMELLPSRSLASYIIEQGTLAQPEAAEIGSAVASALSTAHRAGITHRDVKPGNVLIGENGQIKLTDFGIARNAAEQSMTQTGTVLGSPPYIAPEVAMGRAVGPAADLWGLGATLYACLEGRPPYDGGDPVATVSAVVHGDVPTPAGRGAVIDVIRGLMVKDPARRMALATVRRRLRPLLADPEVPVLSAPSSAVTTTFPRPAFGEDPPPPAAIGPDGRGPSGTLVEGGAVPPVRATDPEALVLGGPPPAGPGEAPAPAGEAVSGLIPVPVAPTGDRSTDAGEARPDGEESPTTGSENEGPAEETPADDTPADDAPADDAPAEEGSADATPASETPPDATPADDAPAEESAGEPAEESAEGSAEKPADDAPAEEPAEEPAAEETAAEAQDEPADDAAGDAAGEEGAGREPAPEDTPPDEDSPGEDTPDGGTGPEAPEAPGARAVREVPEPTAAETTMVARPLDLPAAEATRRVPRPTARPPAAGPAPGRRPPTGAVPVPGRWVPPGTGGTPPSGWAANRGRPGTPAGNQPLAADPGPLPFTSNRPPAPAGGRRRLVTAGVVVLVVVLAVLGALGAYALTRSLAGQPVLGVALEPSGPVVAGDRLVPHADTDERYSGTGLGFRSLVPAGWQQFRLQQPTNDVVVRFVSPEADREIRVDRVVEFFPAQSVSGFVERLADPEQTGTDQAATDVATVVGPALAGAPEPVQQLVYRTRTGADDRVTWTRLVPHGSDLWVVRMTGVTGADDGAAAQFAVIADSFAPGVP